MKKLVVLLLLVSFPALAQFRDAAQILSKTNLPKFTSSCIEKQIATTGHNRLDTAMTAGKAYLVYCHTSGTGAACECLQGGASVDVSSTTSVWLKAGAEYTIRAESGATQLSCQSASGTPVVAVCPLE